MRIFKSSWFTRFAKKVRINDDELKEIVRQFEAGQYDVNLGGDVYKHRIARPSEGKSGGYRVLVFFRKRDRMFFQRGFAKATLDNINPKELITLKKLARYRFSLTDQQLTALVTAKELNEITEEEK